MTSLFVRDSHNPILTPRQVWWEGKGVLNPGVAVVGRKVNLVYRAVGNDGISRFGIAESTDGVDMKLRDHPFFESKPEDAWARLGIEDPRISPIAGTNYVTFTKVSVDRGSCPSLAWETAPFRLRSWIGRFQGIRSIYEVGPVHAGRNTKDLVLFPEKIGDRYVALLREYPDIRLTTAAELGKWSEPKTVLEPVPGTWEGERVGAGPPPVRVPGGWLLLYHANEYLRFPGNVRMYRMGLALLDSDDPSHVVYRHPEPIFEPQEDYERDGPVGNVVFGTGFVDRGGIYNLYYGAADGVIGLARAARDDLLGLLPAWAPGNA